MTLGTPGTRWVHVLVNAATGSEEVSPRVCCGARMGIKADPGPYSAAPEGYPPATSLHRDLIYWFQKGAFHKLVAEYLRRGSLDVYVTWLDRVSNEHSYSAP